MKEREALDLREDFVELFQNHILKFLADYQDRTGNRLHAYFCVIDEDMMPMIMGTMPEKHHQPFLEYLLRVYTHGKFSKSSHILKAPRDDKKV